VPLVFIQAEAFATVFIVIASVALDVETTLLAFMAVVARGILGSARWTGRVRIVGTVVAVWIIPASCNCRGTSLGNVIVSGPSIVDISAGVKVPRLWCGCGGSLREGRDKSC